MNEALGDPTYVSLVTFRRSGVEVAVPVWCARVASTYYVFSAGDAGKVKRLRNDSRVRLAPCDFKGNVLGRYVDGRGVIVAAPEEIEEARRALRAKYGLQMWLADLGARLTGRMRRRAYLAIAVDGSD